MKFTDIARIAVSQRKLKGTNMQNFFSSLVITLREGVEGALAVGIILLYLRKTGRIGLNGAVWWGLATAIVASAIWRCSSGTWPQSIKRSFEGILMFVAAFFRCNNDHLDVAIRERIEEGNRIQSGRNRSAK